MDRYLLKRDFYGVISQSDIDEITDSADDELYKAVDSAVEEVAGYIRHRYDYDQVFQPIQMFSLTKEKAIDDEDAWDVTEAYDAGDLMYYTDYKVYVCITDTIAGESPDTDPAKWGVVAFIAGNRIFWEEDAYSETDTTYDEGTYISYGGKIYVGNTNWYDDYDAIAGTYTIGDKVRYSGNNYECTQNIVVPKAWDSADWSLLVSGTFDATLWTEVANNESYWYVDDTMQSGVLPTEYVNATEGDDRNSKLKEVTIDIALYRLHARITPRDIPDVRRTLYDGYGNLKNGESAISWLEKVQRGTITPDLPKIIGADGDPPQNTERVSWGTSPTTSYKF